MEAHLLDHRRGGVAVGPELAPAAQRVHHQSAPVGAKDELAQVDVPASIGRPPDQLTGRDDVADPDERVDVLVAEVAGVDEPAGAARSRRGDAAALDRVHPVCPAGRRAATPDVVANADVDAVVVDRAAARVGPRVEKRATDRVLPVQRQDRPAAPVVVVRLAHLELTRDTRRHARTIFCGC